jgi:hypothetical protein
MIKIIPKLFSISFESQKNSSQGFYFEVLIILVNIARLWGDNVNT